MLRFAGALAAVALLAVVLVAGTSDSADAANPRNPMEVVEQNVDTDGYIAVHEQGIADVNVVGGSLGVSGPIDANVTGEVSLSAPVDINGPVTVSGTVDVAQPVEVTGTIDVAEPVQVTGTVEVTGAGEPAPLDQRTNSFSIRSLLPDGTPALSAPGVVTAISFRSDKPANLRLLNDGNVVHIFFVDDNLPLNIVFPQPVLADQYTLDCDDTNCRIGYAISGYPAP